MYCHIQKRLTVPCRVIVGPHRREAFSHIGRIQAYFLMEYLKKFAENGKVVRQEDIQEFFQQMQANKRPRVEIPKFCK